MDSVSVLQVKAWLARRHSDAAEVMALIPYRCTSITRDSVLYHPGDLRVLYESIAAGADPEVVVGDPEAAERELIAALRGQLLGKETP